MEARYVNRIQRDGKDWIVVRLVRSTDGYRWLELYRGTSKHIAEAWLESEDKKPSSKRLS